MAKYAIWNKQDDIYTPGGSKKTAQQWMAQYGWLENPATIPVISGGIINGALLDELHQMKDRYSKQGCVFTDDMTDEEALSAIEAFEVEQDAAQAAAAAEAAAAEAAAVQAELDNSARSTAALEAIADGQTTENAAAVNALLTGEEA